LPALGCPLTQPANNNKPVTYKIIRFIQFLSL
jgi:hypothetical protein